MLHFVDRVEKIQLAAASTVINALAAHHKVQPFHVALHVPGLCHAHNPRRDTAPDCAYCRRRGNCFAPAMALAPAPDPADLVARFQLPIFELLVDFADELLDAVAEARGVPVESVRVSHVEPLRAYLRAAVEPAEPGSPLESPLEPTPMLGVLTDVTNTVT